MICPKCSAAMESVVFEKIEVERCTACHGLFFEARKADKLKALAGLGSHRHRYRRRGAEAQLSRSHPLPTRYHTDGAHRGPQAVAHSPGDLPRVSGNFLRRGRVLGLEARDRARCDQGLVRAPSRLNSGPRRGRRSFYVRLLGLRHVDHGLTQPLVAVLVAIDGFQLLLARRPRTRRLRWPRALRPSAWW